MFKWFSGKKVKRQQIIPTPQVATEQLFDIGVSLLLPGKESLPGFIANMDMSGIEIAFLGNNWPDLTQDESVKLKLSIADSSKNCVIDAIVIDSSFDSDTKLYQFKFLYPDTLNYAIKQNLNRRDAFRIVPSNSDPITVYLKSESTSFQGYLIDISATGIGVEIESQEGQSLDNFNNLSLIFNLPGCKTEINLVGIITYQKPKGEKIHYGINFDRENNKNFRHNEMLIISYVMRRQKEILLNRVKVKDVDKR